MKDKIINALYGLAICDAVGNPFEFQTNIEPNDVLEYVQKTKILTISDDTQMTLFGFEAMFNIYKNYRIGMVHSKCIFYPIQTKQSEYYFTYDVINDDFFEKYSPFNKFKEYFTQSYLNWHRTQTESFSDLAKSTDQLLDFQSLWSIQSPGYTCLLSLSDIKNGIPIDNNSKGCGSVMRLLPILLFSDILDINTIIKFGQITGNITHTHEENNIAIDKYIQIAYVLLNDGIIKNQMMISNLVQIYDIQNKKISDYGNGWTALSCVDMGVYAFLKAKTFDELLQISISHDGDSDSVAAISGSLWGLSGKNIPSEYIQKLDALNAIKWTIDKL